MDIGLDVKPPGKTCADDNCPFHGHLKVRGQILNGRVVGDGMSNTVVVERDYLRYLTKFERYEKRKAKYLAHNPACIGAKVGDEVTLIECRPISKAKSFVVIEKSGIVTEEKGPIALEEEMPEPMERTKEKPAETVKEKKKPPAKGKTKKAKKEAAK